MKNWFDGSKHPPEKVPRFLLPFCAWDLKETEVIAAVKNWGLIKKSNVSPLLTNNAVIPVIGVAEYNHFGYSSFEVEFARMIREGKSDRAYWKNLFEMLEYSAKTGRFIKDTLYNTLDALDLKPSDIGLKP